MIGSTISHYTILEKLGEGGMGVVYKAEDTRLRRIVALKFLPAGARVEGEDRIRLVREAQAAASLDHPNICTVYEVDEADGRPFIAMAYIEGQSLKNKIRAGPLKLDDALEIAIQTAQGLQEAHEKGIVHRDIKSSNIMVTPKGQVKIMDFGLAQLSGQTKVTRTGTTLGTPAYMSPEQAQGNPVDVRTDLWSLGVVLYEMITGQLPFRGSSEVAVAHSILHSTPEPITGVRAAVPLEVDRIVSKALAKRPGDRYQHADDLLVDLRLLRKDHESGSSTSGIRRTSLPSVAVLPFVNMNRDEESEFFSDGVTEELIGALSKIEQLQVVSRTSAFQFKGKTQDVREIGDRLRVGMVLEGSVRRAGTRVRVTAQLVNIADGYQVWSDRYDRELHDVFEIQDEIARSIVDALRIKLVGEQHEHLVKRQTENLEAYNLYLKGLYHWKRSAWPKSIECFEQAIALDPHYASARAGLAVAYGSAAFWGLLPPPETWLRAKAAAVEALSLDDSLAEAHYALGLVKAVSECKWAESEHHVRRALELSPNDAMAHYWYAFQLTAMGRLDEAKARLERALELDPLSPPIQSARAWNYWHQRRYDRAIAEAHKALDLDPTYLEAYLALGCAYALQTKYTEAIETFHKAQALAPGAPAVLGLLGWAHGWAGHREQAEQLLHQLKDLSRHTYVSMYAGWIAQALGDHEQALDWFEQAYQQGDALVRYINIAPPYDPLRGEPRFQALILKMGL